MGQYSSSQKRDLEAEGNSGPSKSLPLEQLPLEVLQGILYSVDDATLTNAIPLVCKQFYGVATSIDFWKERCRVKKRQLPPVIPDRDNDYLYFRAIYFKDPYGRNLIKNPSGENEYAHWSISEPNMLRVERPPYGADDDFQSCFATSYRECRRQQVVDLLKEGCDVRLLDSAEFKPTITCVEWHAHRNDCSSTYFLCCELLDVKQRILANQKVKCDEVQWAGGKWKQKTLTFTNYPPGVRSVRFNSFGKDLKFWRGYYGSKMAGASVTLSFESNQLQPQGNA